MTCDQIRSRLSWLLDGELDPTEAAAVRAHTDSCAACKALLAELKSCDGEIRSALAASQPRAGFTGRVMKATRRRPLSWIRIGAGLAAGILLCLWMTALVVNSRTVPALSVAVHGGAGFHADSMGALRVFVTNAATSLPIPGAPVRILLAGMPIGDFVTNAAGSIDGYFRVPDLVDGNYPLSVRVETPYGNDVIERPVSVRREYRLMLTTDKPMYQPGQTIHLRTLALNAFTLKPRTGDVEFEVADSRGNRVHSSRGVLSEFGIASADLTLADEVNLGTYRISVRASGLTQERTVEVAKYSLPKFQIEVEPGKQSYRPQETLRATVRAKYFFGKPVQGRVQARLGRELVTGALKADGSWELEIPAPGEGMVPLEVTITDTADHREAKALPIMVSQDALKAVLYPEGGAVLRGAQNEYYILVSTPDGRPVKADIRLRVNGIQQDFVTDDLGVGKFLALPGDIRLEYARDKAGNETRSLRRIGENNFLDFVIRLDKTTYKGGETMTVKVIGNPNEPVFVDVLKGGQLLLSKVAEKGGTVVDLPPDLFGTVQVMAYTRSSTQPVVRVAYVNLPEGLKIRPRAAKELFRPGEEMTVEFEVLDKNDKPVQAALGLSVVDEALFGLVESKIASEKAWLSLAPELIDTRGFLQADAAAIYQDSTANAQRFVSGNSSASRVPVLAENNYQQRRLELEHWMNQWNDALWSLVIALAVVGGFLLAGAALFFIGRSVAKARVSGVTVIVIVAATILIMLMLIPGTMVSMGVKKSRVLYDSDEETRPVPAMPAFSRAPMDPPVLREDFENRYANGSRPVLVPILKARAKADPKPVVPGGPPKPEAEESGRSAPARIREYFPETLYWQPQLITDDKGRARVTLPAADSITSWRLLANAVSRNGALGTEQANLKVFQDFFVDIDFPVALTKGDLVHVPVAVYNYLKDPQTVAVRVQPEPWFELTDEATRSLALKPGEVSVVYFGLKVKEHGRKTLTVFADGKVQDAIKRSIEVMEKGREVPINASDRVNGRRAFRVEIPQRAIDGASVVFVRVTPGMSDLVTGLEGMIRMPSGCFEQTLSSAYPNLALHAYLQETGQLTKETEARLRQAHSIAVQKLLSFENPAGGFGWYPGHEAKLLLSAYGTMFLADLAKVYDYDRKILDRTVVWLEHHQDSAGAWTGVDHGSTWSRLSNAAIPSTAYVAWALQRAGRTDAASVAKARDYVARFDDDDGYAAALIANAFPTPRSLEQLARLAKDGHWTTKVQSWTRSRDGAADLEATALAVMALTRHAPKLADEAAGWIVRARDPYGSWGSTQATVLALRALTAVGGGSRDKVATKLEVNGKAVPNAFNDSEDAQTFDVSPYLSRGTNEIVLETSRRVNAQVSGRYYVPWGADDLIGAVPGLNLQVTYDRAELKVGETLTCTVKVDADAFAMMAEVAIPPGCTVDSSALEDLVRRKVIDKVGQNGRTLTFYLPGKGATFSFPLKPRYPMKVVVPRSVAYEYYTPDRRVLVPPQALEVKAP